MGLVDVCFLNGLWYCLFWYLMTVLPERWLVITSIMPLSLSTKTWWGTGALTENTDGNDKIHDQVLKPGEEPLNLFGRPQDRGGRGGTMDTR